MINFYGYDSSGADATVKTDFFDIDPNPSEETFRSHNEMLSLKLCGQMSSINSTLHFGKDGVYERFAGGRHKMYDKITIK